MEERSEDELYRLVLYSVVAAHFCLILGSCALTSITHLEPLPLLGKPMHPICTSKVLEVVAARLVKMPSAIGIGFSKCRTGVYHL